MFVLIKFANTFFTRKFILISVSIRVSFMHVASNASWCSQWDHVHICVAVQNNHMHVASIRMAVEIMNWCIIITEPYSCTCMHNSDSPTVSCIANYIRNSLSIGNLCDNNYNVFIIIIQFFCEYACRCGPDCIHVYSYCGQLLLLSRDKVLLLLLYCVNIGIILERLFFPGCTLYLRCVLFLIHNTVSRSPYTLIK